MHSIVAAMTKVIKSYGRGSLPTGHKRPLIYNLSGFAWLKDAGIPLCLEVLRVFICTLRRLTISVGRSRNIWNFDPFKRCPSANMFCTSLYLRKRARIRWGFPSLVFPVRWTRWNSRWNSEHLNIPVRVLKSPFQSPRCLQVVLKVLLWYSINLMFSLREETSSILTRSS